MVASDGKKEADSLLALDSMSEVGPAPEKARSKVFLASAYIGDTGLATIAPGEKFDVAFGVDDQVTVKRMPKSIKEGASRVKARAKRAGPSPAGPDQSRC